MQTSKIKKSLAIAMGASFAATVSAAPMATSADSNPFGMHSLSSGYMQVAEKSMGEASCGGNKKATTSNDKAVEATCGGSKNATTGKNNTMPEGKCGEGKCGEGMMKMDDSDNAGKARQ
jgi:uncharacterized low-complexity protein